MYIYSVDWSSKRFSNGHSLFPVIWDDRMTLFSLFVLPCVRPNGRRESRVQESDGSFFESYTALCWKQENRRLQVLRKDDQSVVAAPEGESWMAIPVDFAQRGKSQQQHWFIFVLYSCRLTLWRVQGPFPTGCPPSWQFQASRSWLPVSIRQTWNPAGRRPPFTAACIVAWFALKTIVGDCWVRWTI